MHGKRITSLLIVHLAGSMAAPSAYTLPAANLTLPHTTTNITAILPLPQTKISINADLWLRASYDEDRKIDWADLYGCLRSIQNTVAVQISKFGDGLIPINTKIECHVDSVYGGVYRDPAFGLTYGTVQDGMKAMYGLVLAGNRPYANQFRIFGNDPDSGESVYGLGYLDTQPDPPRWALKQGAAVTEA